MLWKIDKKTEKLENETNKQIETYSKKTQERINKLLTQTRNFLSRFVLNSCCFIDHFMDFEW